MQYLISTFSFHCLTLTFRRDIHVSAPTHINPALLNSQNENSIRSSSLDSDETANDENTVWTDSQDYCADEILSHPFTLTPTVQRAACALPFEGSPQESTEIIQLIKYPPTLFNLSNLLKGCVPRFSLGFSLKAQHAESRTQPCRYHRQVHSPRPCD